jgi:exonuclease-1
MGIQGLLPALKPLVQSTHISSLKGKRVAVDGYCWIHKSTYSCALELCQNKPTDAWIKYCLSFLDVLLENGLEVTMVFDGAALKAKSGTEDDRRESRKKNLQIANDFYANHDLKNARNYYTRAVDVTPKMAAELLQVIEMSRQNVKCIVAPHEADAQLAFLSRNNLVDIIISEDSDCVVYGCKDILFKLNRDGTCDRLIVDDIYNRFIDNKFDLRGFTYEMFLSMCIISGCDYLVSNSV